MPVLLLAFLGVSNMCFVSSVVFDVCACVSLVSVYLVWRLVSVLYVRMWLCMCMWACVCAFRCLGVIGVIRLHTSDSYTKII